MKDKKGNKIGFRESVKTILRNLDKKIKVMFLSAVILAVLSSSLSIYTPNKMSDLTNEIANGLNIDVNRMERLTKEIVKNIEKAKSTGEKKPIDFDGRTINYYDQVVFLNFAKDIKKLKEDTSKDDTSKMDEGFEILEKLPSSIQGILSSEFDHERIMNLVILLSIIYILSSLFMYLQSFIMAIATNKFAYGLRKKVSEKINRLPLNYFDKNPLGDVLSRVSNDVDSLSANFSQAMSSLASSSFIIFGSTIMMFVTNWILAITAILSSLFGFSFMFIVLSKSQTHFRQRQKRLGEMNGYVEEMFSSLEIVKVYKANKEVANKFNKLNDNLYNSNLRSQFLSGLPMPMMGFVGNLGYFAVTVVGSLLAIKGRISFGIIIAFITYVRMFSNNLSGMAQSFQSLQLALAASGRVFEFLSEEELADESNKTKYLDKNLVKGNMEFRNVVFKYPGNSEPTINNFSLSVKPGEKIAIVGPTGAGKTTMVNLLMKFYEITSGDILIDGVSINDLSRENIHDLFAMVLQDTWLFNGSIKENLKYNLDHIGDEELKVLLKVLGLSHFVNTLPKGVDSKIQDNESVSSGQRQLLTIGRSILKDAPFLILDEATSNVDSRTEILVQEAMDKLMYGRTSFIIAHRLSTIKNADIILYMEHGNILEKGSHDELISQKGLYAKLYNSQFSKENK